MVKMRLELRTASALMNELERRARDEAVSKNEVVNKALTLYLTKDITDESLLIAKMSEMQRLIQLLDRRLDVFQKLELEWFQNCFMWTSAVNEKELPLLRENAAEKMIGFLADFRAKLPEAPALLEALLGDMLEEKA